MKKPWRALAALVMVAAAASTLGATSVVPPSFTEMVERAQVVFVGETVSVESRWVSTSSGPAIVTRVTYRVVRALKGSLGALTTLEFLGGSVGEDRLEVSGMPKFRVGDRDVIFADERGRPVSPIVGFMHGRFRVLEDPETRRESVARYDFRPFASVSEITGGIAPAQVSPATAASGRAASARALSLRDFEDEITRAVRRLPAGR